MKRVTIAILSILLLIALPHHDTFGALKRRGEAVVFVDGMRYQLHTIVAGETLYSLSKAYDVSASEVLDANPILGDGFNIGVTLKIPYKIEDNGRELSERKMLKNYDFHVVKSGETLYSISRLYEISLQHIMEDNQNLDPTTLAIGQRLNIRKSGQGRVDEVDTKAELDEYRKQLNMVVEQGVAYHLVEAGETLLSLSDRFRMESGEIETLNEFNMGQEPVVGSFILVKSDDEADDEAEIVERRLANFVALSPTDTLNVSLLLPLSIRGYALKPMVEFYQGFLLGLDDIKRQGRNVVVNLYNTERDSETLERIVAEEEELAHSDLIVGPVDEKLMPSVLRLAERRNTPVVSPFVTLAHSDSPVLFQMAADPARRYDKLDSLLDSLKSDTPTTVTLIYGETTDSVYEGKVRNILAKYGKEFDRFDYLYEHPSVITEREKIAEERYKLALEEAEWLEMELDSVALDTLRLEPSKSDLTPLICNEAERKLFFVISDNEIEVDRILSALASAYTTQLAINRGTGRNMSELLNFKVVANPAWREYKNIDRTLYFRDRMINFPSYLAGRDAEAIRSFDSRYGEEFSDFPSLYAYRGYDVAKIFGEGLYDDIQYGMEGRSYTPLQNEYRFEQRSDDRSGWVNTNWMKVNYNRNFTLTIE